MHSISLLLPLLAALAGVGAQHCDIRGPRTACGGDHVAEVQCHEHGCCWPEAPQEPGLPPIVLPPCFHPNAGTSEYQLQDAKDTGTELSGTLRLLGSWLPQLGDDLSPLQLAADLRDPAIAHIKITAAEQARWEVPAWLFDRPPPELQVGEQDQQLYSFSYTADPFQMTILRKGMSMSDKTGQQPAVFTTVDQRLIFKDQYLEIQTAIPAASSLYGAGERSASGGFRLARKGRPLALWNVGVEAKTPDQNLYGSQPFVMEVRQDGTTHGLLLLNSNGMDIVADADSLSFRAIGGVLDLYVLLGPTPAAVMEQLTRIIGRPALPPLWSLGFHQSKWGYGSVEELAEVVANYSAAQIPLDTIWTDIDYMDGYRDFTFDPKAFPEDKMKAFVDDLHATQQRWVPILDPGILVEPGYPPYDAGIAADIFIKDATGKPYLGQVWPGMTHFPDFLSERGAEYWRDQVGALHAKVPFDGLWIDMNEVANFCTGQACTVGLRGPPQPVPRNSTSSRSAAANAHLCQLDCSSDLPSLHAQLPTSSVAGPGGNVSVAVPRSNSNADSGTGFTRGLTADQGTAALQPPHVSNLSCLQSLLAPPYRISNCNEGKDLGWFTIPVTATHVDGSLEYNAHNLYGLSEARATAMALTHITQRRPFVLTRSNFLGTGQFAAHWTGDNAATWHDMRWSVTSIFTAGLQAVPFAGADICGFSGNTTEELCSRWISLGAFYPFSRDHTDHRSYQELYRWPPVAHAARKALGLRYRLLPYLYTAFHTASKQGTPVFRPLFFAYPGDPHAHGRDGQFMLGDSLLISPCLHQGATTVDAYFPAGVWYSVWNHSALDAGPAGRTVTLDAPLGDVPVYVRGGSIVPMQQPGLTTAAVRASGLTLLIALQPLAHRHPVVLTPHNSTSKHAALEPSCIATASQLAPDGAALVAAACGEMFVDDGSQLQDDATRSGTVRLSAAFARHAGTGGLVGSMEVRLDAAPAVDGKLTEWCRNVAVPTVQEVILLGVPHQPDERSLFIGNLHPASGVPQYADVERIGDLQVDYDTRLQRLHVRGLRLDACPQGLQLSWSAVKTNDNQTS